MLFIEQSVYYSGASLDVTIMTEEKCGTSFLCSYRNNVECHRVTLIVGDLFVQVAASLRSP